MEGLDHPWGVLNMCGLSVSGTRYIRNNRRLGRCVGSNVLTFLRQIVSAIKIKPVVVWHSNVTTPRHPKQTGQMAFDIPRVESDSESRNSVAAST